MRNKKKGALSIDEAPAIVLIVGLVFLVMATFAFIGEKYGSAILVDTSASESNESGYINATGYTLDGASEFNAGSFVITQALNATDNTTIGSGNYSVSSSGVVTNATATTWDSALISYNYIYNPKTVSYNSTADLQTEIGNNTSIAGIVLTISLVGIVLSLLIGVFLSIGRRSSRI